MKRQRVLNLFQSRELVQLAMGEQDRGGAEEGRERRDWDGEGHGGFFVTIRCVLALFIPLLWALVPLCDVGYTTMVFVWCIRYEAM